MRTGHMRVAFLTSSFAARSVRHTWMPSWVQSDTSSKAETAASSIRLDTSSLVLDFLLVKRSVP